MTLQDFYYKLYSPLTEQGRIYSLLRFIIRKVANTHLKWCFGRKTILSQQIAKDTIVSLTSFPARINYVWLTIESILRQQVRPEKIILWLSKEQFESIEYLPNELKRQFDYGLEVRIVQGDIRSHKKYYYAYKEFPDKRIILIDDDIFYRSDFVKSIVDTYDSCISQQRVVCCYAMHKRYDESGKLAPYNSWPKEYGESNASDLFFGSGGGTIGMAKDFFKDLTNIDLAIRHTPTADDIWLNTMVRLANSEIIKIGKGLFLPVIIKNDKVLYKINRNERSNDVQIENVTKYYHLDKF